MVDFKKLVLEAIAAPSPLIDFYNDSTSFPKIKAKIKQFFGYDQFPPDTIFGPLEYAFTRTTATQLENYARFFPVIDLMFFITEKEIKGTNITGADILKTGKHKIDPSKINVYDQAFASNFDAHVSGGNPFFDYIPQSTIGGTIHLTISKKLSKMVVGQLALENFDQFSIKRALYGLLEGHRKLKLSIFQGKNTPPSSIKFVDDILLNPNKFAGGKTEIPDQFKSLYNSVSVKEIISIAVTANKLFETELTRFNINNPKTTFDNFISNEPLDNNQKFIIQSTPKGYNGVLSKPADPKPGKGGYTIANIKQLNTPQSRELIKELEDLGNYIREGEPVDWSGVLSGATQVAKGLSLGT